MVKKLLVVTFLLLMTGAIVSTSAAQSYGGGLYPFTCRYIPELVYSQVVCLRVVDPVDELPGHFGWLTWDGDHSMEALVASLSETGNVVQMYYNPGTPANGWTPDCLDKVMTIGKWVQATLGKENAAEVRAWLDWHIAELTDMTIAMYDQVAEQGSNAYYRVRAFAGFEILSYEVSGLHPCVYGKFLRWVDN
jgi:hypothetical protein